MRGGLKSYTEGENLNAYQKCLQIGREIERENDQLLDKVEQLLEIYLIAALVICHKRLVRGIIELPQYYRNTQMLQACIERFKEAREL